jgi:hypothetical protein
MGSSTGYICKRCETHFGARSGGGFYFDELHCDQCGRTESIGHKELGDIHLRYVKGLKIPYAIARASMDRWIQANYPGEPLSQDEYQAAAEATLDPCVCGGRFKYDAPPRCPTCRSTSELWDRDPEFGGMLYD